MEKAMKRFIAVLLTVFTCLLGANNAFAADDNNALQQIKESGTLRVGLSTFVPWAMRDKQGDLIGFEVDVAKRLAADAGLKIEFVPTAWDGIIPALLAGKFDVIIGGLTITPERNMSVLFTHPYSYSAVQMVANKKLASKMTTIADYNKRSVTIAVRSGAYPVQTARKLFPKAKLRQFDDETQAFQEVLNGNAQAALASTPTPEQMVLKNPDSLFMPFKKPLTRYATGFAIRQGDFNLLNFLNNWIQVRTEDGWLNERYQYWFKTMNWQDQVNETK